MLNLAKVGRPICRVDKGSESTKNVLVSVSDKPDADADYDSHNRLKIANDGKFQMVPDLTKEREILYITGPSGSGKSTFTRRYIEELRKKKKDMPVYLFSAVKQDESLDSIEPKRIKLDESLISDPIELEDLADSLCIFDDCDVISDRNVREAVYQILNQILETGRHTKTYCIVTNHLATNGRDTRRILNETHAFVFFPSSATGRTVHFLIDYVGLDRKTIKYIKSQQSRSCVIFKNYPQMYLLEREVGLLTALSNDDD